jgi:hypothetical protein
VKKEAFSRDSFGGGGDSKRRFIGNMHDPKAFKKLCRLGWDKTQITYRYNSEKFRSIEFEEPHNAIACFGCSHTLGEGVRQEYRWSDVVAKTLDLKCYNFGVCGSGVNSHYELVNKWFALDDYGKEGYNPQKLIGERGAYSASEQDKAVAGTTVRGLTGLKNTGKFLIKNTFVVFTKLNFVSNEAIALGIKTVSDELANDLTGLPRELALKSSEKIYTKTREGYSVWTTAWLYRLDWTVDTYKALSNLMGKKTAGDVVDFSTLAVDFEFIGDEKATSLVTFSLKEKRTEQHFIELSTIRNLDKVYAKLQKKYDVFKPKSPIIIEDGKIYSQIGMKEGLEGGESFDVLEEIADPETYEMIGYKKVATIKVDKIQIWDNRFGVDEENAQDFNKTLFKGKAKKLSSGMLIIQKK